MSGYDPPTVRIDRDGRIDARILAGRRRDARRCAVRTCRDREQLRDVLAALDLWPYDERDRSVAR